MLKDISSCSTNLGCMKTSISPAKRLRVAIDGPAGSGKSTVAKRIAQTLGYTYFDTGAMYRALAVVAKTRGVPLDDHEALGAMARSAAVRVFDEDGVFRVWVDGEELTDRLREPETDDAVGLLSMALPLREALVSIQRQLAGSGGVVMEGRDITSVVMPDAEVKVFLTADLDVRAQRRWQEMRGRGLKVSRRQVLEDLVSRDNKDLQREWGRLVKVEDAVVVDSSRKTVDETCDEILSLCEAKLSWCTG